MRATRVIALLSIIGMTMAAQASIKQKLAQQGAKTLVENKVTQVADAALTPTTETTAVDAAVVTEPVEGTVECGAPSCDCCRCLPHRVPCCHDCCEPCIPCCGNNECHSINCTDTSIKVCQDTEIKCIPETSFTAEEIHACCACENSVHDSCEHANKIRTFAINGAIRVTESIQFTECSCAEEASCGKSKEKVCHKTDVNECENEEDCYKLCVCPADIKVVDHCCCEPVCGEANPTVIA